MDIPDADDLGRRWPVRGRDGIPCGRPIRKTYSASGTLVNGPNSLYLKVCDNVGCSEKTITVNYVAGSVTVVPVNPSQAVSPGSATIQFDIRNTSQGPTTPSTFTLTPTVTGVVSSCTMSPTSVTLAPGAPSTRVDANCSISSSGSSGSVKLTASTTSPSSFSGEGTTNVTVSLPVYRIAISPATGSAAVAPGTANTYSVVIQNTSTNTASPITVSLHSPSCSGVVVGGCSVPANSASIAQGAQTSPITLSYDALAAGTATVTLIPTGTVSGGTVQVTNGVLNVTVSSSPQPITVVVAGKNPGTTIDKASCLTVAAGQNAAYECGDLRIVHPLPATVTMDRAQAPALIYNSRHANPGALLAADVTFSGTTPTILRATVTVPGQTNPPRDFTWNPACANKACRIVVPIATTQPTGLYPATLQVSAMNGSTVLATSTSVTDTVIVVNRAGSPYGAGWWLDGLESLVTLSSTRML